MLDKYLYNHKGWYEVGGKAFSNKLEAYLALNQIPGNHNIHWNYHDDVFSKANWAVEPPVDVRQIYKERAIQLREQYDHLVLFYSGGADSHTILQTFINNNIKIDEVFVYGAFKAEEKKVKDLGWDRTPGYYTREITQLAVPMLKELQKTHNFKITIWDWTDKTLEVLKTNKDWFWDVGVRYAPDAIPRQYLHEAFRHSDRFEGKGKSVGFIFGVDKPRLFRDDTSVYFSFIDNMLTTAVGNNSDINGRYWENDEYFYWTPNLPDIVVKQAHLVYNFLKRTKQFNKLNHINNLKSFHHADYYMMINPVIYPDWDPNTWQVKKSTSTVKDEFGKWFFDLAPSEYQQNWQNGLHEMERLIGTKWFNNNTVDEGFVGCPSKFYKIADLPNG
jgi:hypothetical protein